MKSKLNIAFALFAGIAGGMLTRYIAPQPAFAQNQAPVTREIRAQTFTLVDPSDRPIGTFSAEGGPLGGVPDGAILRRGPDPRNSIPSRIVLRDATGQEIWSAGGSPIRRLSQR